MATMIKQDSQELVLDAPVELAEKKCRESEMSPGEVRLGDLMTAWGEGRFNMSETIDAAKEEFFSKDLNVDVATANAHAGVAALKQYTFETVNEWFEFLAGFDITDVVATAVTPSNDVGLWQKTVCTLTSKATGRSLSFNNVALYHMHEGKFDRMSLIYANPMALAYLDGTVETLDEVKLPAFEPHPDPKAIYEAALDAWATGQFTHADTKQAALDKFVHSECVIDASSTVLPKPFGAFHGQAGADKWTNEIIGKWDFTRLEISAEKGLTPGCVLQKLDCDVKLEGKEAKGIVIFSELAYNTEGKNMYTKLYYANPHVVAFLYATDSE